MSKDLKLVTFNIRAVWTGDGINAFIHRAGMILNKIDTELPDIICFQEVVEPIGDFLERHMTEYQIIRHGREAGRNGEGLVIALRRVTMEALSTDCFWLSPTPDVPGSRFAEQSNCPRICQTALVRRRKASPGQNAGEPFRIYNNHLDHISDSARILGIRQVMNRVRADQEHCKAPVFIVGDFNAYPTDETILFCNKYEEFPIIELSKDCGTTFHGYGSRKTDCHIDYIFTDRKTASLPFHIERWTDEHEGIYLSDHYPVALTIAMPEGAQE